MRTELDSLLSRREFKGGLTLVETSARENVNVEAAFRCLAYLLDRGRPRFKCPFYADAARQRNEACQVWLFSLLQKHILFHLFPTFMSTELYGDCYSVIKMIQIWPPTVLVKQPDLKQWCLSFCLYPW